MPHPHIELSVNRTQDVAEAAIWTTGNDVAAQRKKTLYARGDVNNSVIRAQGLRTVPDEPPPQHANIIGWPGRTDDSKGDKDKQKVIAMEISEKATLVMNPAHLVTVRFSSGQT